MIKYTDHKVKTAQKIMRGLADYIGVLKLTSISPEFIERELVKIMSTLDVDINRLTTLLTNYNKSL